MSRHRFLRAYLRHSRAAMTGPPLLLWRHRDLVRVLVRREIAQRTSGTVLGGLWMFIQPGLQMFAFWFLLSFVFRIRTQGGQLAYVDYILLSLAFWFMTADILGRSVRVLSEFASLYQRTLFPVVLLPLIPAVVTGAVYALVILLLMPWVAGFQALLWAPLMIAAVLLWLVPLCYLLAVAGLFHKDFVQIVPFLLQLTLYVTPILYLPEMLPEAVRPWLVLNPFADLMALIHGLLQGTSLYWAQGVRPVLLWFLLLGPAWGLFARTEPHFRELL
jgi:lipopolysaccharide transport system permease protein